MEEKITIVATGDSMTDTAGEGMPALREELLRLRPEKTFELINQGVGGTRVGYGLWRLTNAYEWGGRSNPSLISLQPDIVLVESFAYNNGADGPGDDGLKHFRHMHLRIADCIYQHTQAVIVHVITIAPNPHRFLETVPNFAHTPIEIRRRMAYDRICYLEAMEGINIEMDVPLANVYRASLAEVEKGAPIDAFIDPADCIHPGPKGHQLVARVIGQTLVQYGLI